MKYPLPIPIPKHLANDGYIKRINQLAPRIDSSRNSNSRNKKDNKKDYNKKKNKDMDNSDDESDSYALITDEEKFKSKIFFLDDKVSILKADIKRKDQLEARELRLLLRSQQIDESITFTSSPSSPIPNINTSNTNITSKKIRVNDDVFISQQFFSNTNETISSRRSSKKSKSIPTDDIESNQFKQIRKR
jgi:hypothetical protein